MWCRLWLQGQIRKSITNHFFQSTAQIPIYLQNPSKNAIIVGDFDLLTKINNLFDTVMIQSFFELCQLSHFWVFLGSVWFLVFIFSIPDIIWNNFSGNAYNTFFSHIIVRESTRWTRLTINTRLSGWPWWTRRSKWSCWAWTLSYSIASVWESWTTIWNWFWNWKLSKVKIFCWPSFIKTYQYLHRI